MEIANTTKGIFQNNREKDIQSSVVEMKIVKNMEFLHSLMIHVIVLKKRSDKNE